MTSEFIHSMAYSIKKVTEASIQQREQFQALTTLLAPSIDKIISIMTLEESENSLQKADELTFT